LAQAAVGPRLGPAARRPAAALALELERATLALEPEAPARAALVERCRRCLSM
jgi:hypothetical protein